MSQFGQDLRHEREERGVSVDYICAVTKISSRHVQALEDGRFLDLPGGVFRKGIVRSYISVVGLEEAPWIERFEKSLRDTGAVEPEEQDWAEFAHNVRKNRHTKGSVNRMRWVGVMLMVLALLLCSWLTWSFVLRGHLL